MFYPAFEGGCIFLFLSFENSHYIPEGDLNFWSFSAFVFAIVAAIAIIEWQQRGGCICRFHPNSTQHSSDNQRKKMKMNMQKFCHYTRQTRKDGNNTTWQQYRMERRRGFGFQRVARKNLYFFWRKFNWCKVVFPENVLILLLCLLT